MSHRYADQVTGPGTVKKYHAFVCDGCGREVADPDPQGDPPMGWFIVKQMTGNPYTGLLHFCNPAEVGAALVRKAYVKFESKAHTLAGDEPGPRCEGQTSIKGYEGLVMLLPKGARPAICITKFIGSLAIEVQRVRWTVMMQLAVLRFSENSCACEGCVEFLADMYRRSGVGE